MLEVAFEVREKFGRIYRKTVEIATKNKRNTTPETFSSVGSVHNKGI